MANATPPTDPPASGTSGKESEAPAPSPAPAEPPTIDPPSGSRDSALKSLSGENADRLAATLLDRISEEYLGRANIVEIHGGVHVGSGDFNVGSTGTRPRKRRPGARPARMDDGDLRDHTTGFVEPAAFGAAQRVLAERHLLVLSGEYGTGRKATALALLVRVLATPDNATPNITELTTAVLGSASWEAPEQNAGYLVDDTDPDQRAITGASAEQLNDTWLTTMSASLKAANSYLVVTTALLGGKLAEAKERHDFVVEHLTAPDPMEIVRERIRVEVRREEIAVTESEVDIALTEAGADEVLTERPQPHFVARFAKAIARALVRGEDVAEAVAPVCDRREQVREWFRAHTRPEQMAFAIATAVLEQSTYLTLSDAAIDLSRALSGSGDRVATTRFQPTLAEDQPWIELYEDTGPDDPGSPVRSVRFRGQVMQRIVLEHAWTDLDGRRQALLEWLRTLVGHLDVEVRGRAATAAGLLATRDFRHSLHSYLLPWASGDSATERRSAALALGVVGLDPRHSRQVWELLRLWAEDAGQDDDSWLPETATIAVGGVLGRSDPKRALDILHTVLRDGDWPLLEPAAVSILQLVEAGRPAEVLTALLNWTEHEDDSDLVVRALMTFVFTVRQPFIGGDGPDSGRDWPVLLTEARRFRAQLGELWGRALGNAEAREFASEALREWLRFVDADWSAYPLVFDVLTTVAGRSGRDQELLLGRLDRWAEDRDDPSTVAEHLYDALSEWDAYAEEPR